MIYKSGSLFLTDASAIGHGVNCAGVMSSGIAKQFKLSYPKNFENYAAACNNGLLKPGDYQASFENGKYIVNMASQELPGVSAKYEWLFSSTLRTAEWAVDMGLDRVAIPHVGCGIGGLNWFRAVELLKSVEHIVRETRKQDFDWEVWEK